MLFEDVGRRGFFVLWNWRDQLTLLETGVEHVAGALEMAPFTVPYRRYERFARPGSLVELRGMLQDKMEFLDKVEADGWERIGRTWARGGDQYLADTRRPGRG